jgi:hypothetical protein
MKFPRAADDTCTYEYKLRCDCKTNGIEPKRNSEVTGVGFTNKITKKKRFGLKLHRQDNIHVTRKRETVKQRKGRYLPAEKLLRPREIKLTPTRAKWRLCRSRRR